jgi:predicted nucleic acid-binding protein
MPAIRAAYFDSSVLLKRYVREQGTDRALVLTRQYLIVTAAIAPLEMRSALRRIEVEGGLSGKAFQTILKRIQVERDQWDLVAISLEILESAELITVNLNVRSLDALHLASVLACQKRLRRPLPLVTADMRQRDAAQRLGLDIISVEQ